MHILRAALILLPLSAMAAATPTRTGTRSQGSRESSVPAKEPMPQSTKPFKARASLAACSTLNKAEHR